jgi:hypothetical protein
VIDAVSSQYERWVQERGGQDPLHHFKPRAPVTLHAIGDSNSALHWDVLDHAHWLVDVDLRTHWLGPKLMHSAIRDGEELLRVGEYDIGDNDIAMFVFGFIDVSHHLHKYFATQGLAALHSLVDRHFETIRGVMRQLPPSLGVWVHGIVPPTNLLDPQNAHYKQTTPTNSEEEVRMKVLLNIAVNSRMRRLCDDGDGEYGDYHYVDMFDEYADAEGFLKPEHTFFYSHVINYTDATKAHVAETVLQHVRKNTLLR